MVSAPSVSRHSPEATARNPCAHAHSPAGTQTRHSNRGCQLRVPDHSGWGRPSHPTTADRSSWSAQGTAARPRTRQGVTAGAVQKWGSKMSRDFTLFRPQDNQPLCTAGPPGTYQRCLHRKSASALRSKGPRTAPHTTARASEVTQARPETRPETRRAAMSEKILNLFVCIDPSM